ncbi:hypothetical protein [Falsirhodobacter sp. alg1]|uniref:hypothetical protein n=1 Tax=Falsirhodobacter sp. alg1 TaxID=1472418 RepID=UPI0009E918CB|nr:hypothetical protein [Falsirhodobacter sp. alg1]
MQSPVTFDERDWRQLTANDKRVLPLLDRAGFSEISCEILARAVGVGQKSMDSLIDKGLAVECKEEVPGEFLDGKYFKLTKKGILAYCWVKGSQIRTYPE